MATDDAAAAKLAKAKKQADSAAAELARLAEKKKELAKAERAARRKLNAAQDQTKRQADTRRKILAGAWVLEQAEQSQQGRDKLRSGLDSYLKRDDDRALFSDLLGEQNSTENDSDGLTEQATNGTTIDDSPTTDQAFNNRD